MSSLKGGIDRKAPDVWFVLMAAVFVVFAFCAAAGSSQVRVSRVMILEGLPGDSRGVPPISVIQVWPPEGFSQILALGIFFSIKIMRRIRRKKIPFT